MTPQERDVIGGIFDRLKQAANQPREPEAERFIADKIREQPYAPYAMAQAIFVQEQALTNLQAQLDDAQARLRDLESRRAEPAPQSGGFLSGIFGGGSSNRGSVPSFPSRNDTPPVSGQPSSAWTNQSSIAPQPGMHGMAPGGQQSSPWSGAPGQPAAAQPGRGGGFMATALTTAAGVAGGMMLGNVLTNAFGSKPGATETAGKPEQAADTQTAQDNSASTQPASDSTNYDDGSSNAANYQNAGYDQPADDDFAGFDGGGDDWT